MNPLGQKPRDDEVDVFGVTHPGKVRSRNEDQFLIASLHKRLAVHGTSLPRLDAIPLESERLAFVAMVADGVGGGAAGDQASLVAIETATSYLARSIECYYADHMPGGAFADALRNAVASCHQRLLDEAEANPRRRGMATTLTIGIGLWPRAYIVQVGDSRAYLLREGRLVRLTRDQTLEQALVEQGVIPPEEVGHSRLKHVLTSAVGGSEMSPVVTSFVQYPGDAFLLCTDGLTRHVSDDRIAQHLVSMTSAEQACRVLLDEALAGGGSDNVTIVVGRAWSQDGVPGS